MIKDKNDIEYIITILHCVDDMNMLVYSNLVELLHCWLISAEK